MRRHYDMGFVLLALVLLVVAFVVVAWAWGSVFDALQVPHAARLPLIVLWAIAVSK